jgi:hypothetical protein
MAYSFNKINSGVKSFGVHKGALYASEYIMSKKTLTTFCNTNKCENSFFPVKNGKVNTQGNLLMLNKANNLK